MLATSVTLCLPGIISILVPNLVWALGASNMPYLSSYADDEESETLRALSKKKRLNGVRLFGAVMMVIGASLYLIYN